MRDRSQRFASVFRAKQSLVILQFIRYLEYFESRRIYGHRKVHEDLMEDGVICCRETVRRIMRDIGLYSRIKRKFVVTTNSDHTLSIAENLLNREFAAEAPNLKWVADI